MLDEGSLFQTANLRIFCLKYGGRGLIFLKKSVKFAFKSVIPMSHHIYRALVSVLLAALSVVSVHGQYKREMRAVWIATVWGIDWPARSGTSATVAALQRDELRAIIERAARLNFTTVFFQVRGMADAMYRSSLEPWSGFVSGRRGVDPGWDPLEFAVAECHSRGLECYAWVNPFRWSSGTDYDTPSDRRFKNNGWLLRHGKYTVLNPGLEAVRGHVVDVCREIVTGYAVDGLIFDDYFYPNRIPEDASAPDYGLYMSQAPWMNFGDWRRANIHKAVADVRAMISECRPGCRFGISPAGVAGKPETSSARWGAEPCGVKASDWQYDEIYSDPLGLLYQGTIDFVSPQLYWSTSHRTAPFGPLADWWSRTANLYGVQFYSSLTLERLRQGDLAANRRDLLRQIDISRSVSIDGNQGICIYSAKFLADVERELSSAFELPSLSPACPHLLFGSDEPAGPRNVSFRGSLLGWDGSTTEDGPTVRYTVYAVPKDCRNFKDPEGDGIDGRFLCRVVYGSSLDVGSRRDCRYAVCTLSAEGLESRPVWCE